MEVVLSGRQRAVIERPFDRRIFLEGPAGCGKTTVGVARLLRLIESGVPANSILVFVPQRMLVAPYQDALRRPDVRPGGEVMMLTIGGLAQRMVDLFWPLVAEDAGFAHPDEPPVFLTLETAQYYMARLVRPLLDQGYFETVTIDRNRLYSQIIDNLNKAAVVGFPYTQIGARLKAAWGGAQSQRRVYDEAQECAVLFRTYCLEHNLLDFSLQLEVFLQYLWPMPLCRNYLLETYAHLIVDNVEEDVPVAHDLLRQWLPRCRSALVIFDRDGGYRRFLGADPESGYALRELCDERTALDELFVASPHLQALGEELVRSLDRPQHGAGGGRRRGGEDAREALACEYHRYYPQMLDWVADQIADLVHGQGVPAGEIAVLAPFLPDALRFSLASRLEARSVPARSHRPSRALRDEPAARCLLTLAALAHPAWGWRPSPFDVAHALMQALEGLDLVRAWLLTQVAYRVVEGRPTLTAFEQLVPEMQERLTYVLGERYERLREWIEAYVAASPSDPAPLDHFLSRLFGEVLSQAGFGFHHDYDAGRVAAALVESALKFRWAVGPPHVHDAASFDPPLLGREYVHMVREGVIAAQYIGGWRLQPADAVLLAPAHTFLMNNRPVEYQFWLDVGSKGWWERLNQPLTHPYVLSRHWPLDAVWSDADEVEARRETLARLVLGLIRRCRRRVYMSLCELDESGRDQKGTLLKAVQDMLRRLAVVTQV